MELTARYTLSLWSAHVLHLLMKLLHLKIHSLHLHEALHLCTVALSKAQALHAWEGSRRHCVALSGKCLWRLLVGSGHTVFQIVEDAVKVDRVQLHRHLDAWVLRVMDQRRRLLCVVKLTGLDAITLVYRDLLAVENDQVLQLADDVMTILRLASHWVVCQADLHEVHEFSEAIDLLELCQSIAAAVERLQAFKTLDMREALQTVLLELEARYDQVVVERVRVYLANAVLAQIELTKLAELVQVVNLGDLVV